MTTKIIAKENAAVVINIQETEGELQVEARMWVNTRGQVKDNRLFDGDATLTCWNGKTLKAAEKWAHKVLDRHYA